MMAPARFGAFRSRLACLPARMGRAAVIATALLLMMGATATATARGQQAGRTLPAATAETMTDIAAVRRLTPEAAARGVPVRVVGVVTALAGLKKAFFVEDSTAGIDVDRSDPTGALDVHVGDRVEVTGVSTAGLFAPSIMSSGARILGPAPLPRAVPVTSADLLGGAEDSQRVEVTGVVHTAKIGILFDHDVLLVGLDIGGAMVKLMLQDFVGVDYARLIDATIRVRGVCSTDFNDRRQFVGAGLFVPSRKDVEVLQPAGNDPYAGPAVPVRQALQFGKALHRIKVAGVVTWQDAGHHLYLQDGQDGIRIESETTDVLELGTPIEAVGFPATGEYAPVLSGAVIRVTGPPVPLKPLPIEAADVIRLDSYFNKTKYDGELVQIRGKIIESHSDGSGQRTIILSDKNQVFEAYISHFTSDQKGVLPNGSTVLLTGICTIIADADKTPVSFSILLRSAEDVVILKRASWWTQGHALWVLGGLGGVTLFVALWVMVLRARVEQQTRIIRESEHRFRELAERDALTGLPNRLMLDEHITAILDRCKENRKLAAVLTIDIDRFKQINDTYGHPVGDECLRVVASRLRNAAPETETIARTGGEEFTLVAAGMDSRGDADRITNAILDLFHDPMVLGALEIAVTVSVGCALYPNDGTDTAELKKRSDQALYEAKRRGRNRVFFSTKELSAQLEQGAIIEAGVRDAFRAGAFSLAYQPIYDASGSVCRLEALLRTTHEDLAERGPAVYVPVAESSGLILPLGRWVLQEVCRHIAAWRSAGLSVCPISLNISASQLLQSGFSEDVFQTLDGFNLHPSALEFELTETAAMAGFESVADRVSRLAGAGVTFTIDDFGNGSSSLVRLHQLPLTSLKISRSFVQKIDEGDGTLPLIQAMIKMSEGLGLQTVAVGVERPAQEQLLRELGCDLFQGFLLARPMPPSAVTALLKENASRVLSVAS